jgi:predicted nucleotidyltransferase
MQFGWQNAPEVTRHQVELFVLGSHAVLGEDLTAVYLHGSLAMGCFNPERSDLDLLVISERRLSAEDRAAFAKLLVEISGSPHPIETSVVARDELHEWQYPTPYEFHYGEDHLRYLYQSALDDLDFWQTPQPTRTDPDLAAHFVISRERGIPLVGDSPRKLLPEVPVDDYVDSILGDFDDAGTNIQSATVYGVLNLCRVYWFLQKNAIASKDEAGEWALSTLPDEYRQVVSQALREYRGGEGHYDPAALQRFVDYIDAQVRTLLS